MPRGARLREAARRVDRDHQRARRERLDAVVAAAGRTRGRRRRWAWRQEGAPCGPAPARPSMPERWAKQRGAAAVICAARSQDADDERSEFLYFSSVAARARRGGAGEMSVYASSPRGHLADHRVDLRRERADRPLERSGRPAVVRSSAPAAPTAPGGRAGRGASRATRRATRCRPPSSARAPPGVRAGGEPPPAASPRAARAGEISSEHCIPFTARVSE